jgi:hypothetical protein
MLNLSEVMMQHHDLNHFEDLVKLIKQLAETSGERFFRMDVRPSYPDTPENWEDRLEAAFN